VIFADIALRPEVEITISKFPHPAKDEKPSAVFHHMDQSDWSQISATWDFALKTFGRVDLLCPGAGLWYVFKSFAHLNILLSLLFCLL
jgi:NAD(P)-dependent dehydrogenase (short-subunit alcohol dehydrogenase family)